MNKEIKDFFIKKVNSHFIFLKDLYNFQLNVVKEWPFCIEISFKNSTAGVVLIYDAREGVDGFLVTLNGGELSAYALDSWFRIIRLKKLTKKENKIIDGNIFNFHKKEYINSALELLAKILASEGEKALNGDFSQFKDWVKKLKDIVEKQNQGRHY